MKKISAALVFLLASLAGYAQSYVQMFVTAQPCNNDGIVTAVATNLTTPLTYTWNVGGAIVVHSGVNSLSDQIPNWSGVSTSVGVTDANGAYVSMVNFASLPFTVTTNTSPALCPALGSGTAVASGGATPYIYTWTDMSGNVAGSGSSVTLPGGQYNLLVTDASGCTVVSGADSASNGIYVEESAPFYPMIATTTASCTNGTATVNLSGSGAAPYTYVWSNGAASTSLSNLMMGAYSVVVTDANGCHATGWGYVEQNPFIQVNASTTPATCLQNDGAGMVFGSGGTPPYTYLWSNGATGPSLTNVPSDFYTVYVTDANGCIGNGGIWISASTPVTATYSATPSQCTTANGTATVTPAGGTAPYSVT